MGNTSTTISELVSKPPITRDELYKRTNEYRNLLNDIFYYMMNEIKINDFIQLSTSAGCKKYVLFMANNLQLFFHQMKVDITRDKHGILAFRRVSDLETPTDEAKKQKETLCTVLAYYYTRVFQIYGAIVLTTVDDVSDIIQMAEAISQDTVLDILPAPGHPRTTIRESKRIFGGAIPEFGILKFIHPFMTMMPGKNEYMRYNERGGYLTNYRGRGQDDVVYFLPDREQIDDMGRPIKSDDFKGSGRFSIRLPETEKLSYVTIHVEDDRRGQITCRLYSLSYFTKGSPRPTTEYVMKGKPIFDLFTENNVPYEITLIRGPDANQTTIHTYYIKDSSLTVPDYFQKVFTFIIPYLRKQTISSTDRSIVEKSSTRGLDLTYAVDSIKNKPQARCISRIHQLLQQEPFAGDPSGKRFVSSICENTFFTNPLDKTTSRKDIPLPGHSIGESKGLKATIELFFDTVTEATPHLVMSNESFQQYRTFMLQLVALNEGTAAMHAKAQERDLTVESIKDIRTEQHVCTEYKNKKIPLSMEQAVTLKPFIAGLFKRHVEHIVKCNDLLHALFYIEHSKNDIHQKHVRISLSDNIKKGGIVELNRIGKLVREQLVHYFIDCDKGYLAAEEAVLDMKQEEKILAAKAIEQKRKVSEQAAAQAAAARIAQDTPARAAQASQPVQPPNNAPRGYTAAGLAQQAAAIGQQRLNLGEATRTTTAAQLAAQKAQQAAQEAQRRAANAATQQTALQEAARQRITDEEIRKRLAGMTTATRSNLRTVEEAARLGATGTRERKPPVRFGQGGGKTRKRRST